MVSTIIREYAFHTCFDKLVAEFDQMLLATVAQQRTRPVATRVVNTTIMSFTTIQSRRMELTKEEADCILKRTTKDMQDYVEGLQRSREKVQEQVNLNSSCVDLYGKQHDIGWYNVSLETIS